MANVGSQIPVFQGAWADQSYLRGDLVLRSGVLYQAATDTSAQPGAISATPGKGNPASWTNVTALVLDFTGSTVPTAGAGIPAAISSTYHMAAGGLYVKTGAGATAWTDAAPLLVAEVTLDNEQIKALGADPDGTFVTLVAAPGPGRMVMFDHGIVVVDTTVNAYNNFDPTVTMQFTTSDGDGLSWPAQHTSATALLGIAFDIIIGLFPQAAPPSASDNTYLRASQVANEALCLMVYNGSAGAFSDGDPANSMRIKVWYTIENLP